MEKALRRRVGADSIDIDTRDGYVRFTLEEPEPLDFSLFEKAADDAGYTLTGIVMDLRGQARETGGERTFHIDGTREAFAMTGDVPLDTPVVVTGRITDWLEDSPQLAVESWREPSPAGLEPR